MNTTRHRVSISLGLLLAALFAGGCRRAQPVPAAQPEAPVLLICVDGVEISLVRKLLEQNQLPNLAALIDRGVFGALRTFTPAESPMIWTSIATGKAPDQHQIQGFVDPRTGTPFTSNARRGKALWNIASDYGLKSNSVGYWISWPAEEVLGTVVTQFATQDQIQDQKNMKGSLHKDLEGATWPAGYVEEIWPLVEREGSAEAIAEQVLEPVFGHEQDVEVPPVIAELISGSLWSFRADQIYHAVAKQLFETDPGALNIVYYGGSDVIGHRFWRYLEPEKFTYPIPEEHVRAFGGAIANYYRILDRRVGELVALFGEQARVIVVSDHGMHADFLDGLSDGKPVPTSGHHLDGPPGIFIAAGPGIRRGAGVKGFLRSSQPSQPSQWGMAGTVFDLAPTLLYLLDIPVPDDLDRGAVLTRILTEEQLTRRPPARVDTHDEGFRPATPSISADSRADEEFIERMRQLGYF